MKKLILFISLIASPVFAQEEEQDIQIEIESGCAAEVAIGGGEGERAIAAFPDKSVFTFHRNARNIIPSVYYCWVDESEEPRCKEVDVER